MSDEDWLILIAEVEDRLEQVGAAALADQNLYAEVDSETGRLRLYPPAKRLLLMLEAFERLMKVRDAATYRKALDTLNGRLGQSVDGRLIDGGRIERVEILPADGEGALVPIELGNRAELEPALGQISEMITRLRGEAGGADVYS